jgi:hypothetical protein
MTTLISNNKYGSFHKLKRPYHLTLVNTSTPFGLQENYNKKIVHWYIKSIDDIKLVRHYQEDLQNILNNNLPINTKITQKDKYPPIIETNISQYIDSNTCISHKDGEIVTYNSIIKGTSGNVFLVCENIVIMDNKVNMVWNINRIVRSSK